MAALSEKRKKELTEKFNNEILTYVNYTYDLKGGTDKEERFEVDGDNILENDSWGGYSSICSWAGSCGNQEWIGIADNELSDFKTGEEVAYWLSLIKKTFKKHQLGNLFLSFPCDAYTGKPLKLYSKIAKAVAVLKLRRLTRAVNPNHRNHFQDVYMVLKDNY